MTIAVNNLAFLLFNLLMAWHHSNLIKDNKKVKHGLWSLLYTISLLPFCFLFSWWYAAMGVFLRGWFFSPALNAFRGYGLDYWSLTSTSLIDKGERVVFRKFWIARLFYFIGWIIFIIIESKRQ